MNIEEVYRAGLERLAEAECARARAVWGEQPVGRPSSDRSEPLRADDIRAALAQGVSVRDMARNLNVSVARLRKAASRNRIALPRVVPAAPPSRARIEELHATGVTRTAAARQLRMTGDALAYHEKKHGLRLIWGRRDG